MLRRLRELLDEVDLATTTERQLRKMLEAELEIDLKEFKPQIRQCVNEYLEQHIAEQGLQAAQEPAAAANVRAWMLVADVSRGGGRRQAAC